MSFPWQLQIGSLQIPWHVLFETAGIFIGFRYFMYLRSKQTDSISIPNRIWILIGAIFGSVIGSRLIGGFENPIAMQQADNLLFHFYQNKTIVGGLLGGLAGVELIKKAIKESQSSGDLFTYPLVFAMIIGRVGCFSMGVYEDTYGTVTNLPFGMNLGDGQLRHPVTLYEIFFLFCLWISLLQLEKKYSLANGGRFKLFMISYLVFRLLLDFIKPGFDVFIGLSTIQLTCIAGLLYYSAYLFKPKKLLTVYA